MTYRYHSGTNHFLDLIYSVCMPPIIDKSGRITDHSIVRTNGYCFTTGLNSRVILVAIPLFCDVLHGRLIVIPATAIEPTNCALYVLLNRRILY